MSTSVVYPPRQWRPDLLLQAVDAMTAVPEATDLAFVQYSMDLMGGWDGIRSELPPLPGTEEHHSRYHPDLLPQFVPDACGALALTDAHLARANDLRDWSVEGLGHGRHLVRARDLAAWFAQPHPDSAVLAKGRADVGATILTLADIDANPPPQPPSTTTS